MTPPGGRITAWHIFHDTEIDPRSPQRFPTRISRGGRVRIEWTFTSIEEAQAFLDSLEIPDFTKQAHNG